VRTQHSLESFYNNLYSIQTKANTHTRTQQQLHQQQYIQRILLYYDHTWFS